jgi:membrane protease YdiL (CAAX protease family)
MSIASRHRIPLFLLLTYALSSIFYVRIASAGKLKMLPVLGLMWCPGAAALIVRLVSQRNLRGSGWQWGATRWQFVSYLLPPALAVSVYGFAWLTGIGIFSAAGLGKETGLLVPLPVTIVVLATLGFLQAAIFALGEEIGWRGFLVPELAQGSTFTVTALISGAAWSIYHYPLILFANYNGGVAKWFALLVFTWMAVAASFVFAWLRLKSGSVWTAVILHASHNLFIQEIFDPLTKDRGLTRYVTSEFGVGLAFAYTILALYFWGRRGEVSRRKNDTRRALVRDASGPALF